MKRILLFLLIFLLVGVTLIGCSSAENDERANYEMEYVSEGNGIYKCYLIYFSSRQAYLDYLESFNFEEYEILDISPRGAYYMITYRDKVKNLIQTTNIEIVEILESPISYIVVGKDGSVLVIPNEVCEFTISKTVNVLILEKDGESISKALFCITQEMMDSIE